MTIEHVYNPVNNRTETKHVFTPHRYPYTYAFDFYRTHQGFFTNAPNRMIGRPHANRLIREYAESVGQEYFALVFALANTHLMEEAIVASPQQRSDAIADQMAGFWKTPVYRSLLDNKIVITRDDAIHFITNLGLPKPNAR